jgi:hypothetical protein
MSGCGRCVIVVSLIAASCLWAPAGAAQPAGNAVPSESEWLSQPPSRPRIRVTPLPGPLRRECVAVFEERWIPQWGGLVLYPGQRCWWTRAPA